MANRNTKAARNRKENGYKVSTGVTVNSSKLRKESGKKPYMGLTSKSRGRIGIVAESE